MGLVFKIAWRNLWKHKGKCLVIGAIIFLGALLMTVGNGIISGMEEGLSENIVNLFTGDIVLISDEQEKNNVLFDMMSGKPLNVIKNYEDVNSVLKDEKILQDYLPAAAGMVFILDTGSDMGTIMLLGVDMKRYKRMFPDSFKVIEGSLMESGERGLLISDYARRELYNFLDFWILPEGEELNPDGLPENISSDNLVIKRDIVLMGASSSNSTIDIRVPVKGIINYKSLNRVWGTYCIVDIESFREAHNYVTGADSTVEISGETKGLLEKDNFDEIFSSGDLFADDAITEENIELESIQSETSRDAAVKNLDAGSYNVVFLKLNGGISQQKALKQLNKLFDEKGLNVRAVSWKDSIGTIGSTAVMIKGALNIFIMFIFFVAIIVIMNTLSMSAIERISEIAMMRAIGARKGFLRKMYLLETGILSFFFGGIGIVAGIAIIYILRAANITTTNEILQMVYGGNTLSPVFTLSDLLIGITELTIVTLLSVIYPLRVVGKIVPLDAVVRE